MLSAALMDWISASTSVCSASHYYCPAASNPSNCGFPGDAYSVSSMEGYPSNWGYSFAVDASSVRMKGNTSNCGCSFPCSVRSSRYSLRDVTFSPYNSLVVHCTYIHTGCHVHTLNPHVCAWLPHQVILTFSSLPTQGVHTTLVSILLANAS